MIHAPKICPICKCEFVPLMIRRVTCYDNPLCTIELKRLNKLKSYVRVKDRKASHHNHSNPFLCAGFKSVSSQQIQSPQ